MFKLIAFTSFLVSVAVLSNATAADCSVSGTFAISEEFGPVYSYQYTGGGGALRSVAEPRFTPGERKPIQFGRFDDNLHPAVKRLVRALSERGYKFENKNGAIAIHVDVIKLGAVRLTLRARLKDVKDGSTSSAGAYDIANEISHSVDTPVSCDWNGLGYPQWDVWPVECRGGETTVAGGYEPIDLAAIVKSVATQIPACR